MKKEISLSKANIYCFGATYLPMLSAITVLFFGYSIVFFIMGIPLLLLGFYCLIKITIFLITSKNTFASLRKIIIDVILVIVLVTLSMIFTTAKIVETPTGFTIQQDGNMPVTILFIVLFLTEFIILIKTNQKVGKAYLTEKKAININVII